MEPIFSTRFYEEDVTKSYDCYIIDDDKIRIIISYDNIEKESVTLTEKELLNILSQDTTDECFEIDSIKIKKSFIKNLKVLLIQSDDDSNATTGFIDLATYD